MSLICNTCSILVSAQICLTIDTVENGMKIRGRGEGGRGERKSKYFRA